MRGEVMMGETLKTCPFCGGEAEIERYGDSRKSTIYTCTECICIHETGEEWGHGAGWNRRSLPAAVEVVREAALARDFVQNPMGLRFMRLLDALSGGNGGQGAETAVSGIRQPETEDGRLEAVSAPLRNERGAVTVDWVALTAAVLLLGTVAIYTIFQSGVTPLVGTINETLAGVGEIECRDDLIEIDARLGECRAGE